MSVKGLGCGIGSLFDRVALAVALYRRRKTQVDASESDCVYDTFVVWLISLNSHVWHVVDTIGRMYDLNLPYPCELELRHRSYPS
jgi:hypothetical protein